MIIPTIIALIVLCVLRLVSLARAMYEENENTLTITTDAYVQNINATVLQRDDIPEEVDMVSEEDMAVQFSERVFFDCYKSLN